MSDATTCAYCNGQVTGFEALPALGIVFICLTCHATYAIVREEPVA